VKHYEVVYRTVKENHVIQQGIGVKLNAKASGCTQKPRPLDSMPTPVLKAEAKA